MKLTHRIAACLLALSFLLVLGTPSLAEEQSETPKEMININTATVDELSQLNRVGPSYAQKIVNYREQNGPFQAPEDIMLVKGIGQRTWEENMGQITVEMPPVEEKAAEEKPAEMKQ